MSTNGGKAKTMLDKLVLFGVGYLLGARAGRERFEELVGMAKELAGRNEVAMALAVVRGIAEERLGFSAERLAA